MKSKDLHFQLLLDEALAQACGGMNGLSQASTAQAMKAAYDSLNYKYNRDTPAGIPFQGPPRRLR